MNIRKIIREELSNRELYRSRKILSSPYEGLRFKSIHNDDVEYYTIIDVVDNDDEPTHLKISNSLDRTHSRIEYNEWMDRVRVNDFIAVDVERDRPLRESVDRNKVVRLTESDLERLVKRIIEENESKEDLFNKFTEEDLEEIKGNVIRYLQPGFFDDWEAKHYMEEVVGNDKELYKSLVDWLESNGVNFRPFFK
jgi:hypothetical protein